MIKHYSVYTLLCILVFHTSCKEQKQTEQPKDTISSETKDVITSNAPNSITRTIEQDRSGNIWIATFQGVFQYDGKSFTNMTSEVSSARFFSVLEDRNGNIWLGSIGSGVYYYPSAYFGSAQHKSLRAGGKSYKNFTTKDGLVNNEVTSIYEDKTGNIWFGVNGGVSRYDPSAPLRTGGKSFRNYLLSGDSIIEDRTGKTFPDFRRPPNEVTSIIEDKTGKFWFGTRGSTFVYDGKTFTAITNNGKPFKNVRTIIEDTKGNIWLGGNDGLWRYDPSAHFGSAQNKSLREDGSTFTNFTQKFVGYIIEDKKGNIWTSSVSDSGQGWALSRYDEKSMFSKKITVTETDLPSKMIFGIFEDDAGNIWFGSNGVYRYDGNTITDFKVNSQN